MLGKVNLKDSYAIIKNGEVFILGMHISPYEYGNIFNKDPLRNRKLLLNKREINRLIGLTKQKGYSGRVLNLWIPVYGVLHGVFNIRRQLNSQEVIKLKKEIYALENENKDPSCNEQLLIPQLLNKYFWLIDYYVQTHENATKINDILLKIRLLDNSVYENYIK